MLLGCVSLILNGADMSPKFTPHVVFIDKERRATENYAILVGGSDKGEMAI